MAACEQNAFLMCRDRFKTWLLYRCGSYRVHITNLLANVSVCSRVKSSETNRRTVSIGPKGRWLPSIVAAEFRNPGRQSARLRLRVIIVRLPERRQVPSEVQFEVARNAVTDVADLGTARLCTGQGQQWEEQVVARLKLGSCRRPESIDLGLRCGQRFTVERGQTPGERIDERVEGVIVQRAVHPAIALGDISVEVVTAEHDLKCPRAADQARQPFQRSAARDQSDADLGVAE